MAALTRPATRGALVCALWPATRGGATHPVGASHRPAIEMTVAVGHTSDVTPVAGAQPLVTPEAMTDNCSPRTSMRPSV